MKFQITADRTRALMLFLISCLVCGCVSSGSLIKPNRLSIEKVNSQKSHIESIHVGKVDSGISIVGTVKFAHRRMAPPPGYMEVTILTRGGKVLYKAHTAYYRYGRPIKASNTFNFALEIPATPPAGSIVRLAHRDSS